MTRTTIRQCWHEYYSLSRKLLKTEQDVRTMGALVEQMFEIAIRRVREGEPKITESTTITPNQMELAHRLLDAAAEDTE